MQTSPADYSRTCTAVKPSVVSAGGKVSVKRLPTSDSSYPYTSEQWTENPRVGGSIPPLATRFNKAPWRGFRLCGQS